MGASLRLERVPVNVANGHGRVSQGELIVLDRERDALADGKTPKVLSVDSLLKGFLAILLAVLVPVLGS